MPATKKKKDVKVRWVNKDEFSAMVDSRARRVLGISAAQFIARWKNGRYRNLDADTCPGAAELAILAPLPKEKRGRKKSKRGRR
jgi:hypothetical protein